MVHQKPIVVLSQERDGMHWQKNWPASRQGNGFFEVWPVGLIFFHFHLWGLHLFIRRKSKNFRTLNASQSQDGGFFEDLFAVCPETWVALDTANLVTFCSEVWQKCTNFFPSATQPLRREKLNYKTRWVPDKTVAMDDF